MSFGAPLGIAGVGLIGGSIALRARRAGISVVGFDRDADATALADSAAQSLEELASRCRTVVLALPLDATLEAIDALRSRASSGVELVMDVASVKTPVMQRAANWAPFVGTHPIAGAERGGAAHARQDLFVERTWTYVPSLPERDSHVCSFIEAMGARPFPIDAEQHDRALALTSHLPQLISTTLGAMLEQSGICAELGGTGLASTLRLAGSPWALWETILRANASAVGAAAREFAERLGALTQELSAGELPRTASSFESANRAYEKFSREPQ
ncbi:MAG: prephenate dehydrogenase [Vulcanimicrobiaceae bacterium]